MNLQDYIERSKILDIVIIPEKFREELLSQLEDGVQLPDLVADSPFLVDGLPRPQLKRLFEARAEWRARRRAVERLEASLERAGLPIPPLAARERALVPHKVDALERAVRICPQEGFEDEEAWADALSGLLDVWSGAVVQTLRRGSLKVRLNDHPDASQFEQYARRKEVLSDLPAHRWQAIRRGERAGILSVEFDPPLSSVKGHLEGIKPRLGPTAGGRETDDLVDELVLSVLSGYLRNILDQRAETEAVRSAVTLYQKLLASAPLAEGRVGAVAVRGDGSRVGAVVVSDGDLPELQEEMDTSTDGWENEVTGLFSVAGVEQVVVPMSSPAEDVLRRLNEALSEDYELAKVRVAALSEARKLLTEPPLSLPPVVAAAVVLARRALQPVAEWERVDPVAIGLADYQQDLSEERLREALLEALGLFQLDRQSGAFVPPAARSSARKQAAAKQRLNPLVKTLSDLRPGMTLDGIITNITRFGAFVNVGLSDEGMIHISELSTEYVQSPSDVVSIGDRVQARVLDVEPHKKRIALSLKPGPPGADDRPSEQRGRGGGDRRDGRDSRDAGGKKVPLDTRLRPSRGKYGGRPRGGGQSSNVNRSSALQQLENLFKK